jgi:hypothetical protein
MSQTLKKADGDLVVLDSTGRMYFVEGIEKLTQDVGDCLMVTYDPERDFGQELEQILANNARTSFLNVINSAYIKTRVEEAINRLKSLQTSRQYQIDAYEMIDKIEDLKVYHIGKTGYAFVVDVSPVAGPDKNPLAFQVKLSHQLLDTAKINLPGMVLDDNR